MRFLGFELKRVAQPVPDYRGGWWPIVREPFAGAWQRDIEWNVDSVMAHYAVFACVTLIASDIAKMRPRLMELTKDGIWVETSSAAFAPVLRKPNTYQNRIQFIEWWMLSKLMRGNTYALKQYDERGVVRRLYLLDPQRVTVLVAPDGSVFYDLNADNLSGVKMGGVQVPASYIIHDRFNCMFHPLVGVSPLYAAGPAAMLGLNIQNNAASFFGNGSNPSGLLTTAVSITPQKAQEISDRWNNGFSGENAGKVAVLGDGMKFEPLRMTAVDAQMLEQGKHTAETVCACFHVPPFKIGIGQAPAQPNAAALLNGIYYSDCLQAHIEQFELCMDEGLSLGEGNAKDGRTLGVELELDTLLRMDPATLVDALATSVGSGIHAPNEARKRMDLPPAKGGEHPYLQQQNYSLEALAERDKNAPPPNTPGDRRQNGTSPAALPPPPPDDDEEDDDAERRALVELFAKAIAA